MKAKLLNTEKTEPPEREKKFRKALPPLKPIRRFGDLGRGTSTAMAAKDEGGRMKADEGRGEAQSSSFIIPPSSLLSFQIPCPLIKLICDQWDLYRFVVPATFVDEKFGKRMPGIVDFLRAQARRICPTTGEIAWREKNPKALLPIEATPEGLYALLFFCCAGHGNLLDPVRDVIEPVLWAWESRDLTRRAEDERQAVGAADAPQAT